MLLNLGPWAWQGELADFAACILSEEKREPVASAKEAYEDLRVMLTMMKAGKTRRWEAVADLEGDASCGTIDAMEADGAQRL